MPDIRLNQSYSNLLEQNVNFIQYTYLVALLPLSPGVGEGHGAQRFTHGLPEALVRDVPLHDLLQHNHTFRGGSRTSQKMAPTPKENASQLFGQIFLKTVWKWRILGRGTPKFVCVDQSFHTNKGGSRITGFEVGLLINYTRRGRSRITRF